jgi:glutamate racemase
MCSWLTSRGCDAIVIACKTATAQAISLIRQELAHVPIIGVEPGIKPAALKSKSKMIGVLATQNTLISDKFKQLLASLMSDCEFIQQAGNGLVPLIEKGVLDGPLIESLLHQYIDPMLALGADTIVLGCTHYPFLHASIQKLYGDQLDIIDTSQAIVRQMRRLINDPVSENMGRVDVYSTQNGASLLVLAQKLLGHANLNTAGAHTVTM